MEAIKINIEVGLSQSAEKLLTAILGIGISQEGLHLTNSNIEIKEVKQKTIDAITEVPVVTNKTPAVEEEKKEGEDEDDIKIEDVRTVMRKLYDMGPNGSQLCKDILSSKGAATLTKIDKSAYKDLISEFNKAIKEYK